MTVGKDQGAGSADPVLPDTDRGWLARPGAKHALMAFGWINVGVGAVGVVVPGLPTTIFLIIALWAFSKSSDRFHNWLYAHPRFGPPLQAWHTHRVIPPRAKALAVALMAVSWAVLTFAVADGWVMPAAVGAVLVAVALYIVTRPSRVSG